jgi:NadR type nicotinamide-nucleotide adenylyltransferase
VPISGTAVRADTLGNLEFLDPHVRAYFVKRVVVLGAESTGKSTLCVDLAAHYGVPHLAEFGRRYTEAQPEPTRYRWDAEDMRTIAATQMRFEDDMARWVGPLLLCDTNAFTTQLFCEAYLGKPDPVVGQIADERRYALTILCDVETPFAQDSTLMRRDGEIRHEFDRRYRERLEATGEPWIRVSGTRAQRLAQAVAAIDAMLAGVAPEPLELAV